MNMSDGESSGRFFVDATIRPRRSLKDVGLARLRKQEEAVTLVF